MSAISTSIQIDDRMSPVLSSITTAMNMMVSSFGAAQTASETAINTAQWEAAVQQVNIAAAAVVQYQEELERVQNKPVSVPEPTWAQTSEPKVFTSYGADRFVAEYQSANQMAQKLYQTQQAISSQANRMSVIPPGMLNDMASIQNRIQSLSNQIQQLNDIPVNLRTEQINNQIEAMRGNLGQIVPIQNELNDAISRMDIGAANKAYQQLNSVVNTAERNIRDNIAAQERFNQSVHAGSSAYDGLGSRIKQLVGMYTGAQGIKMAVHFIGDTTSLQNVQSEAETKLGAIMRQRMGASPADIQSVKELTAAQQALGVVGDEVQLSGAQQLATFLNSTDALNTLIPAMNNLAVQQNGVNVSTQDAVNIGNMMGKVMQGQVGALTRVGVTFDAAQEKILKYGNEQERAATLAEVVTNNVSNMNAIMANTPQGQIQQMANTWGDIKETVGARLYPAMMQFFATVNANMPAAETAVMGFAGVLSDIIPIVGQVIESMVGAAGFIRDNWSWLGPVIGGVAAALIAYKGVVIAYNTVQAVSNGLKAIAAARAALKTSADLAEAAATATAAGAQNGLNMALLACPLTWIVIAIMAVIAAILVWIHHVGGIKVAWLTVVNSVLTWADKLRIGFVTTWNGIQNGIDNMQYGFVAFRTGVLNTLGNLKVAGLTILQDFINGAIDRINKLIQLTNSIAGTSIEVISHVEFATGAALEEEAKQKQRAADLATLQNQNLADKKARAQNLYWMQYEANQSQKERERRIAAAKAEAEEKKNAKNTAEENYYSGGVGPEIAGNTGSTAANTAAIKDSMDIMDEDLKYMRDAAEQEIINRFTLAELKVDVKNNNTLTKKTDFDDMGRALSMFTSEFLAAAAEGGHI
ncbi:hypothetical protein MCJ35_31330 [Enterocloster sp. OA13]|uniref:hypothetical protein n=1 Tax=Enterocloster sp. OA13 TaxID=2914161 RepID=UPI001F057BF3|nr:hypothetical protein [Enterocloster sp. OA13]